MPRRRSSATTSVHCASSTYAAGIASRRVATKRSTTGMKTFFISPVR
ncbi:MAG: hypothetical protein IPG05_15680 [Gemmatimonadetes bacterium]|nr:hypothetical protein [Gemmatimonadota bacterium]